LGIFVPVSAGEEEERGRRRMEGGVERPPGWRDRSSPRIPELRTSGTPTPPGRILSAPSLGIYPQIRRLHQVAEKEELEEGETSGK
jgi:hypothetical protein